MSRPNEYRSATVCGILAEETVEYAQGFEAGYCAAYLEPRCSNTFMDFALRKIMEFIKIDWLSCLVNALLLDAAAFLRFSNCSAPKIHAEMSSMKDAVVDILMYSVFTVVIDCTAPETAWLLVNTLRLIAYAITFQCSELPRLPCAAPFPS